MARKRNRIKESQQAAQGINIGTQGNQGGRTTEGQKGPHRKRQVQRDRRIPNQDRSHGGRQSP